MEAITLAWIQIFSKLSHEIKFFLNRQTILIKPKKEVNRQNFLRVVENIFPCHFFQTK